MTLSRFTIDSFTIHDSRFTIDDSRSQMIKKKEKEEGYVFTDIHVDSAGSFELPVNEKRTR